MRRVKMQEMGIAFEIKRPPAYKKLVCIYRLLYQNVMGNAIQKSTKDTHAKKKMQPKQH